MTNDNDTMGRSRFSPVGSHDSDGVDRILIAVCAAFWLTALAAGVAATVALVGLTSNQSVGTEESDTPWLLYTVIGVSAAVIIGAIPLLIRARRASSDAAFDSSLSSARSDDAAPVAQRLEPFGAPVVSRTPISAAVSQVGFPTAAVEQVWLRCTVIIGAAIGAALTAVGVGTYLLASDHLTAGWIGFGVAGVVTVAMPVVPWHFLRELRGVLDSFKRV